MAFAGTMPCDTSRDAFTSGGRRPSQPARTRLRGALITSGSHSKRRAVYCGAAFSIGLGRDHVVCRQAMPVASEGGGIAHGLIGSRCRIRLPVPAEAYDASLVENTMNRPLTSTSGLVLSTSPLHRVSLL